MADDFVAYVDSIGGPTGLLVGWSGGANWALAVAAQSELLDAVAPIESAANSLTSRSKRLSAMPSPEMGELANEGNLTAAARAFAGYPFNGEDIVIAEDVAYFEATGRYVPNPARLLPTNDGVPRSHA